MSLEEFATRDSLEQLDHLRQANARLSRQLAEARASKAELVQAVYRAASDAISGLTIPPVVPPVKDARRRDAETAVAVLSDLQLAKVTPTYNSDVCEQRIEEYARKVAKLVEIQRSDHPVRDLRIYLLGDVVEGELIFGGQAHRIDASLYRQVVVDAPRILANFTRTMLGIFERVHVVTVIGNHGALGGRARKDYHPESNADAMAYEVTRQILSAEKRLTWAANSSPGERKWYAVDQIGSQGFLLFHGDQVKGGFAGFPWYGFGRRLGGWRNGAIAEPFNYAVSGHFHTPVRLFVNTITLWGNGSTESSNTYAAEELAAAGEPCQWLLFVHPERGVTAEYLVKLGD